MILQEKLMQDLHQAMKKGDVARRSAIRMLRARLANLEIEVRRPLDEGEVLAAVAKEVRLREESIAEFKKGQRPDLVAREEAEMAILQEYLPSQLTADEIVAAAQQVIAVVGAHGLGDKGKVMGPLMAQLRGRADGRVVNEVVTKLLSPD